MKPQFKRPGYVDNMNDLILLWATGPYIHGGFKTPSDIWEVPQLNQRLS